MAASKRRQDPPITEDEDYWADVEWSDEDEAALEEWEERRRQKLAEANEY